MNTRLMKWAMLSVFVLGVQGAAWAQDSGTTPPPEGTPPPVAGTVETGMYTKETWPGQVVMRPLTLAKGMIEIAGNTFYANLSTDNVFKPFGLAPSVAYGLSDTMQLKLYHFRGICLAGDQNGCPSVYNDVAVEFAYNLMPAGEFNLAVHGALEFLNFKDPPGLFMGVRVGALGRYRIGTQMAIVFDPSLYIGLTNREILGIGANKEFLAIPLWFQFQATPQLMAFLTTAFGGPLDGFGDSYTGLLGVGATYNINAMLDVGLEFDFTNLYGKGGGGDGRELFIRVAIRL